MGIPQQGSIEGPRERSSNQDDEGKNNNGGPDVNGSIRSANSAAESFLSSVGAVEVELEQEVMSLEEQVRLLGTHISGLNGQISSLQKELDNMPDCEEDDDIKYKTEADLAGENPCKNLAPAMNPDGSPS